MNEQEFFYPRSRYYGEFTPEKLVFNANLQEFSQRIGYICNLQTAGKITAEEAYQEIKNLWGQLKDSKTELNIGENPV